VCACVCVYVCVHVFVCVCVRARARERVRVRVRVRVRAYIYIYTYTYHETRAEVAFHRRALAGAVAAICTNSLAFVNLAVAIAGVAGVLSGRAEM